MVQMGATQYIVKWSKAALTLNGMGVVESTLEVFPPLCKNVWHQRPETFLLLILTYGSLFAVAFVNISSTVFGMATLLLDRGRMNLVKNIVKPIYFYLYGKTDMKYEISVSELTPPPNFSLIPLKIKKLDFDPQNKE